MKLKVNEKEKFFYGKRINKTKNILGDMDVSECNTFDKGRQKMPS